MVLAWTLFACMGACAKHCYTYTAPIVAFFFQNMGALLFLTPYFFSRGTSWIHGGAWPYLCLRGVLGGLSFFALFTALEKIPLTDGTVLNNTAPLFVPFLSAIFLKIPLRLPNFLSALIGFSGVLLMLKPTESVLSLDALPALCSGIMSAFVLIVMRKLANHSPKQILFVYLSITSLASAPFAIPQLSLLPSVAWGPLLCVGALFGLGQLLFTLALRCAEPTVLSPFTYTLVIVSGLIDWGLWGHAPSLLSGIGILFVLLGGLLTIRSGKKPTPPEIAT